METQYAISPDGTRIAFDRCGEGPALVLIHGGGGSRQEWHEAGYVNQLQSKFTVISIDLRGHGGSDLPTDPGAYTTYAMGDDILSVADACGFDGFILWGMSFGSKICRYLAVRSDRVSRLVLIGTQFGLGVSGQLRQDAVDFVEHWPAILEAQNLGTLDMNSLSQGDRDMLSNHNVSVVLAWVQAMLAWPLVVPGDLRCPTLWLAGSEDQHAMDSISEYSEDLPSSTIQVEILDGLDHMEAFDAIDTVLPKLLAFSV